ncbi:MAG TPA: C_GCAxxG_C_C family protein [Deltaproteobacteria bacterium]|nr:C_GCAxxG_C_C family protein [Deltaproteobacteria bacterium]
MIDQVAQQSMNHFKSGYFCAESVLLAVSEHYGIRSSFIPGIATGFCSGTSRTSGLCGAVAGGILSINLFSGRRSPKDSVEENYKYVREFMQIFQEKFGTTNCAELIGCELGTKAGQKKFKKENLKEECFRFTQEATRMAMTIIERI